MNKKISIKKFKTFINQTPIVMFNDIIEIVSAKKIRIHKFIVLKMNEPKNLRLKSRCEVRYGTYDDIAEMARLENKSKDEFLKRFRNGDLCFVSINKNNKIIGYVWCTSKNYHVEKRFNYCVTVPNDSIYAYDGFIDKYYRLSGIWVAFQYKMLEQVKLEGRRYIFSMVDCDNLNSLKSHLRFGYNISKKVYLLKYKNRCFTKEIVMQ